MNFDHATRARLAAWRYAVDDQSISTRLLTPFWEACVRLVPHAIAPNTITLCSALCNVLSGLAIVAAALEGTTATGAAWCAASAGFAFGGQTLDAIDGKHSRNTGQSSPLGEFWDHGCDAVTGPMIGVLSSPMSCGVCLGPTFYVAVLVFALGFREPHVDALCTGVVYFPRYLGSGEAGLITDLLLLLRAARGNRGVAPLDWLPASWQPALRRVAPTELAVELAIILPFLLPIILDMLRSLGRGLAHANPDHRYSVRRLAVCTALDVAAAAYGYLHLSTDATGAPLRPFTTGELSALGPPVTIALVSSIGTLESILCKMSSRRLPAAVPYVTALLLGLALAPGCWPLAVAGTLVYHLLLTQAVCMALKLPLLRRRTNVYIDGVFDMCHLGHFNVIKGAACCGDRLLVGLGTDECCAAYKRPPLMSFDERRNTLLALPWVHGVIPIDEFGEYPAEFFRKHHIDVLAHGEEYDPQLNPEYARRLAKKACPDYFRVAREEGVVKVALLPRTPGVSTSGIIQRLADRIENDKDSVLKRNDGGGADTKNM
jgi:cytidyltransferase-like protein